MDTISSGGVIAPDSRLRDRARGLIRGLFPLLGHAINWVPIFCANCGKPNGYVPAENCDFVCWLCTPCSEKHGAEYGGALVPDEIFWQKAKHEQLSMYGRLLSPRELQAVAESGNGPLATLLSEKRP